MRTDSSPILRLTIPMTLGMCGAMLFLPALDVTITFVAACAFTAALFFFVKRLKHSHVFIILATAAACSIGATLYTRTYHNIANGVPTDSTRCCGTLAALPQPKANSTALRLRQHNGTHIIIYVGLGDGDDATRLAALNIGDTITAKTLHLHHTADDNGDKRFSFYNKYLFHSGVCATAYTPCGQWSVKPNSDEPSILQRLNALQDTLHELYAAHGIDGDDGGIVEAMTIGRRSNITADTKQHYAQAGISHVLALSGMHVGIILTILQCLLFTHVINIRWRWVSHTLIIGVLWAYVAVAGSSASLVRAATMCTIILLCQSFTHEAMSLNTVAITFTIMLCVNPMYLHDTSFQLSFASVFGIALFASTAKSALKRRHGVLHYIWDMVCVSAICSLATAPIVAHQFGHIPVYGIATNIIIALAVTALMTTAVAWWMTVAWWTAAANVLTDCLMHLSHTVTRVAEWIAALPCSTIEWHPSIWGVLMCYAVYALTGMAIYEWRKR